MLRSSGGQLLQLVELVADVAELGVLGGPGRRCQALTGCQAAYYLVHSLESEDFEDKDAQAARNFGQAAADASLELIVYLGGLGVDDGDLSAHLRSRRQVEKLLAQAGVPVTVLRAAVVIGHGGISWESPASWSTTCP